jgi:TonB-linked SusC/RagA family outer membrane protein
LPGTTVIVKGTTRGTTTDAKGHYSLEAAVGDTLVFKSIGYGETHLAVGSSRVVDARLQPSFNRLNDVVVVAYGTQRKKDITGSIQEIDASGMQDVPAAQFGQKLQGKVTGVQIAQTTGRPGEGLTFRIRGAASLGSGNQPLIVVDGQPVTGDINTIDPNNIQSYSILKDASATALYGSRAANGVIIITTKHAVIGKTQISFNAYVGTQVVPRKGRPPMMTAREFATFMNGFYADKIAYENWTDPATGKAEIPADYADPGQYGKGTDWYSALMRHAPIQNYSVTLSSGTEKVSSSTTLSYFNQQGVMINTGMKRFSLRSDNEYRPSDRVRVGLNIAPMFQMDHNTFTGTDGNRQILSGAEISSPLIPVRNTDGSFTTTTSSYGMYALPNFVQQLTDLSDDENRLRLLANAYLDVELLAGLHVKTAFNTDLGTSNENVFHPSSWGYFGHPPPNQASAAAANYNYWSWLNENELSYEFSVDKHHFNLLAGYSAQEYSRNYTAANGNTFANDEIPWISAAAVTSGNSNNTAWTMASWYGRLNYSYADKYFLSANIRRDGSSRFGNEKKYGYFPSVSAGWILSEEPFFPQSGVISFVKLRGSYGLTGNNNIGDYTQISLMSPTNYVFSDALSQGLSITQLGNKDLTWETSKQLDLGVDLNLLHGRITFTYDYYRKTTEDMLYQVNIPWSSGYASIKYNVGNFRFWGHEFGVTSRNLTGKLTWTTDLNVSYNANKVISLQDNTPIGGVSTYNDYNRTAVGHPIGELWGYVFDGVYMNQKEFDDAPKASSSAVGSVRMKDINGDGVITSDDKTFLGNPSPRFIFGMTNQFAYGNFDLAIVMAGQTGNRIMNTNLQNLDNLDGIFNMEKSMAGTWRSEANPGNGKVPSTRSNTTELYRLGNSVQVFSGDYLTVKNITLGYTFKQHAIRYAQSLRLYASIQQALVFTRYPGQNPEVNDTQDNQLTAGQDNGSYPIPRTYMLGVNINF